jgi:GNAT superfamily N-acetyltransferase
MKLIRQFAPEDTAACLDIHTANLSRSLIPSQYGAEFEAQLADPSSLTLVFILDERVVACGSVSYCLRESSAWLSFGMVHPDFQRRGIGSTMLLTRMSLLDVSPERPCTVYLSATRYSKGFFSKHGFGWCGTNGDAHGNEFETFYFPMTAPTMHSIRQTLKRADVPYDANLKVPPMAALFQKAANT